MSEKKSVPEGRVLFIGHNLECQHATFDPEDVEWFSKLQNENEFRKSLVVIVQNDPHRLPMIVKNQIGPL